MWKRKWCERDDAYLVHACPCPFLSDSAESDGVTIPSDHCITKLSNFDRSRISHVRACTNYFQTLCASVVRTDSRGRGRTGVGGGVNFTCLPEGKREMLYIRQSVRENERETHTHRVKKETTDTFDKQRRKSCRSAGAHPAIFISNQINRPSQRCCTPNVARLFLFSFYRNPLLDPRQGSMKNSAPSDQQKGTVNYRLDDGWTGSPMLLYCRYRSRTAATKFVRICKRICISLC